MSFESAYTQTKKFEGGYANSVLDGGGETYKGIARNFHSKWPGWPAIDDAKRVIEAKNGPKNWNTTSNWKLVDQLIGNDAAINSLVSDFYKKEFYDKAAAFGFPEILTDKHFDCAVNCGFGGAGKILQRACNAEISKRSGALLGVDGAIGPKTKAAVTHLSSTQNGLMDLMRSYCDAQANHYLNGIVKTFPNARQSYINRAWWLPA